MNMINHFNGNDISYDVDDRLVGQAYETIKATRR